MIELLQEPQDDLSPEARSIAERFVAARARVAVWTIRPCPDRWPVGRVSVRVAPFPKGWPS
jgi:hypothetical protein